ncbi:MAG: uL15m family ribosomal protein [Patescibacteria group bacterium]
MSSPFIPLSQNIHLPKAPPLAPQPEKAIVLKKDVSPEAKAAIEAAGGTVVGFRNCWSSTCRCSNHPTYGEKATLPLGTTWEDGGKLRLPTGVLLSATRWSVYCFGDLYLAD